MRINIQPITEIFRKIGADKVFRSCGKPSIHFPPVINNIIPLYKPNVPKVATIAGIRKSVTNTPFSNPAVKPQSKVRVKALASPNPALSRLPTITALNPIVEPTDTSIFRVKMTKVAPIASKITI